MRILLTNDDGIHSPGLWSVARALKDLGELIVVAPDRDQSGVGPAMTLLHILRAQQVFSPVEGVKAFAVEGTPGDCVILATEHLFNDMPIDLVVSGANLGANLGLDVMTSGTVGGAFHGYFRNIPSIAVSVASLADVQYEAAAMTARALVQAICRDFLPRPLLLNVNLPNVPPDRIEGVQLTRLGPRIYLEGVERGNDGRRTHYWIRHNKPVNPAITQDTDIWAVRNNRISITPLDLAFFNGLNGGPSPAFEVLTDAVAECLGLPPNGARPPVAHV